MSILSRLIVVAALLLWPLPAVAALLHGTVTDAGDGTVVPWATVTVKPGNHVTQTDADGRFAMDLTAGDYEVTVTFVGYEPTTTRVRLGSAGQRLTLTLRENPTVLDEVVVTATESSGLTSSSRIDRDAMSHLQPTSFTDLLELLPGNISHTPDMGSANTIKLRETGTLGATGTATDNPDYAISSLGTLFVIDGAPVNGDANLQSVPGSTSDPTSAEAKRDVTNRGVDMRTIGTDNIESVEILRGIPGAEYGNLTSGVVNIKRIRRATPFTARFKADQYSKMVAVGKGLPLGASRQIVNVDLSYLDSKVDPRNNLENYKRLTVSARANLRLGGQRTVANWVVGMDYTGSFDDAKSDPDLSHNKINEYKSRYNRYNLVSQLTLNFPRVSWLDAVSVNTAADYRHDRLERRKQVAPQRASVAPTSMSGGVHDGQYLLSEYVADFVSDGRPLNVFVKAKAEGSARAAGMTHAYKLGGEWTLSKNYGDGQVYDLTQPLSASWPTRPRAYKDVPALNVLSFFAEDGITATPGRHRLELQAGVRTIALAGLDSRYSLAGKVYLDPRVNFKWTLPAITVGSRQLKLHVAAGYGLTTKMPTVAYLFPQNRYTDFVQLNYYDVNHPSTLSRVNLCTYITDVTNYRLTPARNRKFEARVGASLGKNTLSVTYYNEHMTSGFRYSTVYLPYSYTSYDASAVDPSTLTAPPALETLPSVAVRELSGYSTPTNGSRIDKQGVEFVVSTARWRPLATALTVTGAWMRTVYSNSQMLYDPVSDVVDGTVISRRYVGYYDSDDGRVNDQFNTNFMFDTQIKRWGLVFSTSIQCMWWVSTRKMWQNGVPVSYIAADDGLLHPYDEAAAGDVLLRHLTRTYNDAQFARQTIPVALYLNLKATKEIGRHLKVAVFVNRLLDYLPDYHSNGLTVRRTSDPYFGMELNLSL